MMTSLQKLRWQRGLLIGTAGVLLTAMFAWNILRPPPEEKVAADFTEAMANQNWRNMDEARRREFRGQWEKFSPETRKQVIFGLARHELERFREQTAVLTPEERSRRIQQAVVETRQHRRQLTPEQQAGMRERLESPAGQEAVKNVLDFYQSELKARERAELDPLVHEWLDQAEQMFGK